MEKADDEEKEEGREKRGSETGQGQEATEDGTENAEPGEREERLDEEEVEGKGGGRGAEGGGEEGEKMDLKGEEGGAEEPEEATEGREEAREELEVAAFPSPHFLYEDAYFKSEDYYRNNAHDYDWLEAAGAADEAERKEAEMRVGNGYYDCCHDGDGSTEERSFLTQGGEEKEGDSRHAGNACSVNSSTRARVREDTHDQPRHVLQERRSRQRRQQQRRQRCGREEEEEEVNEEEGNLAERQQQERQQQEEREGRQMEMQQFSQESTREEKKAVGEGMYKNEKEGKCQERRQLQAADRQQRQLRKGEERLRRQRQRVEERKKREAQRKQEREERRRVQQQTYQIKFYFAGVEAAVLLALRELLERPSFVKLKEEITFFDVTARQQLQGLQSRAAGALAADFPTTAGVISLDACPSRLTISPAVLDEEFTAAETLARLSPAPLCIVCMPHPVQNSLHELQRELQRQRSTQEKMIAKHPRTLVKDQPSFFVEGRDGFEFGRRLLQHSSSSSGSSDAEILNGTRSSSSSVEGAVTDNTGTTEIVHLSKVYARLLVVPIISQIATLQTWESCSCCKLSSANSSHVLNCAENGSALPHNPDLHQSEIFSVDNDSFLCSSGDTTESERGSGASTSRTHRRSCTKKTAARTLEGDLADISLPQQLVKLLAEIRGAGRIVCVFQGIRASLAVPQPQLNDEASAGGEENENICISLSSPFSSRLFSGCTRKCKSASSRAPIAAGGCADCGRFAATMGGAAPRHRARAEKGKAAGCTSESKTTADTESVEDCKSTSFATFIEANEEGGETAGSERLRTCTFDVEVCHSSKWRRNNGEACSQKISISSPGGLDEIIATLLMDCGIDCVEPPDATSTAEYLLTAVKHMRVEQGTPGEQHLRRKKNKTITAANEAVFAEIAQAATSNAADIAVLHSPREAKRAKPPTPSESGQQATPCDAGKGEACDSLEGTMLAPSTEEAASSASADRRMATDAATEVLMGDALAMQSSRSAAADREKCRCDDVFSGYEDVFSFACRLWGKQLVQIPTVTEKVAAAVMRRYRRPAALLQRIRVAETEAARAAACAARATAIYADQSTERGNLAHVTAGPCVLRRGSSRVLVQTRLLPLQSIKGKRKQKRNEKGRRARELVKKKYTEEGLERVVKELAGIVLDTAPKSASHANCLEPKMSAEEKEASGASTACTKRAKIGTARARKICCLFAKAAWGEAVIR